MKGMIATALIGAAITALTLRVDIVSAQEQTIYKWVDEEGVVHYTARPPENVDYVEVGIDMREPAEPEQTAGQSETGSDDTAADPVQEQAQARRTTLSEEEMAERCDQARSNIDDLTRYQNVTVTGDDGEQHSISDEERMRMIEEAQRFIDEWC